MNCYPCSLDTQLFLRLQEQVTAVSLDRSDMHRWMAAFPNPTNPDGDEDEVIYEDWGEDYSYSNTLSVFNTHSFLRLCVCVSDCPQVQCVEQYTAQQADELTLEPTEIINVIRKTNEGKSPAWITDQRVTKIVVAMVTACLATLTSMLQCRSI